MYMEIPILVGIMLALLGIGIIIGTIVQKVIDDAKLHAEREERRRERAEFERERQNAARAYLISMDLVREEQRRREEDGRAFSAYAEDMKEALRREQLRTDIYRKGGKA